MGSNLIAVELQPAISASDGNLDGEPAKDGGKLPRIYEEFYSRPVLDAKDRASGIGENPNPRISLAEHVHSFE